MIHFSPYFYPSSSFSSIRFVEWFWLDFKHQLKERSKNAKTKVHSSFTQHERSYPHRNLKTYTFTYSDDSWPFLFSFIQIQSFSPGKYSRFAAISKVKLKFKKKKKMAFYSWWILTRAKEINHNHSRRFKLLLKNVLFFSSSGAVPWVSLKRSQT